MATNQWLNLSGTQSGQLQLGINGPKIIAENGNLNVRDAANTGFTTVNAANVVVHNNTTGFSIVLGVPDNQTSDTLLTLPPNNGTSGQYLQTDGTGNAVWANLETTAFANGLTNIALPLVDGNINMTVGTSPNIVVVTTEGIQTSGNLQANNATVAANLTANNANITSNLAANNATFGNLLVNLDAIITGNLDVLGSLNTTSTNSFSVVSPIIELGTGPNGDPLTTNDGMDRGILLDHYDGAPVQAFMGLKSSVDEFIFGARVSNINNVITVVDYGNIRAGTLFANLEGNLGNGTSQVSIPQADGNINLSVDGTSNVVVVASTGIHITGNTDITGNLVVTGTSNLGNVGNLTVTGGTDGQFLKTDGNGNLEWATVGSNALVNGNSNITILANAAVNISANGVANVVSVSEAAANITGNLKVSGVTRLGSLGNVKITGGNADQFIKTDGTGNLVFADPSALALVNGNTNVTTTPNGNITMAVTGTANVFVVAQTGTETLGNANVDGNITATNTVTSVDANILGNLVTLNANVDGLLAANTSTANSLTVSGNTTLANLGVTGNALFTGNLNITGKANLGAPANITITGGSNGQVLRTDGLGNLSWLSVGTPNALVNGNSNVTVTANSDILLSVGGFANIVTVSTAGIQVVGTSNLGNLGNVRILGGTANYLLQTDGTGNLTWIAPPSATSIINGNSNVVVSANGNVTTSVAGNANVFVVTGTGANLTGNLQVAANLTAANANIAGNLAANNAAIANILTANTANIAANLTASNANITALLTSLDANITGNLTTANANVTVMLLAANANVAGTVTANNANITTRVTAGNANITANLVTSNANITTLLTSLDANITANLTANTANVTGNLTALNANITGNTEVLNITATGNVVLGAVGDITITGGNNLQVLTTDGNGNLTWSTAAGGSALTVQSNGAELTTTANTLNFTGAGAEVTANGNIITVDIRAASAIIQQSLLLTSSSNANGQSFTDDAITNLVSNTQSSVFVNGVLARPQDYTIAGNTLTFNRILKSGDEITAQPVNVTVTTPQTAIANGNTSVVATANGNITMTVAGTASVVQVAATGIKVTGNTDLGVAANVKIGGGANGQVLTSDGANNTSWVNPQIPGASTVKKITGNGFNGMLTLMSDGRLYLTRGQTSGGYFCYYETTGTTTYTDSFYGVEATHEIYKPITETGKIIDAGVYGSSAYMLIDNGNLYTWGYNFEGQLGLGDTANRSQPTLANTNVVQVYTHGTNSQRTASYNRLIIKKTDGKIYGCGYNAFGQLGVGNATNQYNSFVEIPAAGTNPMSVWNMGNYLGCLVVQKSDGSVVVSGYNGFGQLGNNTTTNILSLTAIPAWQNSDNTLVLQNVSGGFGYVDSSAQNYTNLFMWFKNSSTDLLKGAGANNWGSLATGNLTDSRVPVTITVPGTGRFQEFGAIGGGPASCFVLRDTGRLYGWGYNDQGTLGLGDYAAKTTVQFITDGVTEMPLLQVPHTTSYEYWSTLYIKKTDGYYYACGRTYEGQSGTGTYLVDKSNVLTRMRLPPGTNIKFWGRNINNNTRFNVFMVDENNRWWATGWTAGYAITNQQWATNNQVPSPFRVNPYNLLFNQF